MTAQEQECCKHMTHMCGSTHMPQSHSCCKSDAQSGTNIVVTNPQQFGLALQTTAAAVAPGSPPPASVAVGSTRHLSSEFLHAPSVLRI